MKKLLFYTLFIVAAFQFAGCKKYLDKLPDNRTSLDSPEKVAELLVSAYPEACYFPFTEAMSDNVADVPNAPSSTANASIFSDSYFWKDVEVSAQEQDSPDFYWNACYNAIAASNQALDAILKAPNPDAYKAQKGEALVTRAYSHFMLVALFAKTYNSTTAGSDMGIPYVTEPENVVIKKYQRGTVQSVYDQIEKDLLEGLPLLSDTYVAPKFHFTRSAANAFAARFYLYKKDYNKVIEYANKVFGNTNVASLLRPWSAYVNLPHDDLEAIYTNSNQPAILLLSEASSVWARDYRINRYSLDANIQRYVYASNPTGGDYLYSTYFFEWGTYYIPKFLEKFKTIDINATTGIPYVMAPLFTMEEVLFNRAEAYTMLNRNADALNDLNSFVSTRIRSYSPAEHNLTEQKIRSYYGTNNTTFALILSILDFKQAEFMHEGMRWFDILRWGASITHTTSTGQVLQLSSDDLRKVIQIPEQAASLSELPLNPR